MMWPLTPLAVLRAALGPVAGAAAALLLVAPVQANGAHLASQEVYAGEAGPYSIRVTTVPVAGPMHVSVFVAHRGTAAPVLDAEVEVGASKVGGGGTGVGPVAAPRTVLGPNWFEVDLPVEEPGEWTFSVSVVAPASRETVSFPVYVREPAETNVLLVTAVAAAAGLLVLWASRWWLGRGRRRQPVRGRRRR